MASDDCQEKPPGLSLKGCNILGIFSPRNEEVKKEKISEIVNLDQKRGITKCRHQPSPRRRRGGRGAVQAPSKERKYNEIVKQRRQTEIDQKLREVRGIAEGGESSNEEAEKEEGSSWHLNNRNSSN